MIQSTPPANLYEGNGQLSLVTPIPGAHPQHTDVIVTPERIEVVARCKYPQSRQHYHRHEWQVGSWELSVDLPRPVDPAGAKATLNLGVLVVMAPVADSGAFDGNGHRAEVAVTVIEAEARD
jgi:HSP20 family molecular chaperone IbpA